MVKCCKLTISLLVLLSVMISGCSSRLYTSLVSSDDDLNQEFAGLSAVSSENGEILSQSSQSIVDDSLQAGVSNQTNLSGTPVDLPPQPRYGASESASVSSSKKQGDSGTQLHLTDGENSKGSPIGRNGETSGFKGEEFHASLQPKPENNGAFPTVGESRLNANGNETIAAIPSSSTDDIAPLNSHDLLTEMAAASGTSRGSNTDPSSSRQRGTEMLPLGGELLGKESIGDVYFDFDAATLRSDAETTLQVNAQILKASFDGRPFVIEGHADERGTAEYNLILGERRARSTKQYLVDLGVSSASIQTISYGKEKPFCNASLPDCWKKNRRGHFVLE